jgi:NADH dehydrogenase
MILVAGGTGRLGRLLVDRLAASGRRVRVLTRDPNRVNGLPAEVSAGDVRDQASLRTAVKGASVVVSAVHGFLGGRGSGPEEIDHRGNLNLVREARDAGVEHVVLVSVLDASPDHPMSLFRAKHAAEQALTSSGLAWTILRPSAYVETWIEIVGGKLGTGGPAMVFGRGDNPINFVSVQDVAAITERAIVDPALRDRAIDLPGLDNLTMTQLAGLLGADRVRHVPRGALRLFATGLPLLVPVLARQSAAALVMDTADMSADATDLLQTFPDVAWHRASDVAGASRTSQQRGGTGRPGPAVHP